MGPFNLENCFNRFGVPSVKTVFNIEKVLWLAALLGEKLQCWIECWVSNAESADVGDVIIFVIVEVGNLVVVDIVVDDLDRGTVFVVIGDVIKDSVDLTEKVSTIADDDEGSDVIWLVDDVMLVVEEPCVDDSMIWMVQLMLFWVKFNETIFSLQGRMFPTRVT